MPKFTVTLLYMLFHYKCATSDVLFFSSNLTKLSSINLTSCYKKIYLYSFILFFGDTRVLLRNFKILFKHTLFLSCYLFTRTRKINSSSKVVNRFKITDNQNLISYENLIKKVRNT